MLGEHGSSAAASPCSSAVSPWRRPKGCGGAASSASLPTFLPRRPPPPTSVLDLVASLVDHSLLHVDVESGADTRYGTLEMIREYAPVRLAASKEEERSRSVHATWCLAFAEVAVAPSREADAIVWLDILEREHPTFRAALAWLAQRSDGKRLHRLAAALAPFWLDHPHYGVGRRWLELARSHGSEAPAAERPRTLTAASSMAWFQVDNAPAHSWDEQAIALARQTGAPERRRLRSSTSVRP